MKGDIKIRISGPVGCGKSTVAQVIIKALYEAGLTELDYTSPEPQQIIQEEEFQTKRIKAVRNNKITIEELTLRPSIIDGNVSQGVEPIISTKYTRKKR